MARYDIAIVGTGPAGISAAITAKIRNKEVLLIGSKALSTKVGKAHLIQNYPGLPNISGEELSARLQKHLSDMGIEITEDRIAQIYAMGAYFALQGKEMYEASTVILASGVTFAKPLPGEEEFLGKGVSYCATCDAALYKGKSAAVIGYSPKEEAEAAFLAEVANQVYYLPQYAGKVSMPKNVDIVEAAPKEIKEAGAQKTLVTDKYDITVDGVFLLREIVAADKLVPGLQLDGLHVQVDRSMQTNLKGLFACGDITGTPYQYIKSAGEGNVAALSAAAYLDAKH